MIQPRLYNGFRWLSLLLISALMNAACGLPVTGTPTPAPTSAPVATALPQGVLYQEDFTDPDSGWPVETGEAYKIGYHPPDFYHLEVSTPDNSETVFEGEVFGDFTVETDVLVDHTSDQAPTGVFWYGLAIRGSPDQYYAFTIFPRTQVWQVYKVSTAGSVVLAQGADGSIQGMTARDNLRVDAKGSDFVFHINDQAVAQIQDADYGEGEIGFVVQTADEPLAHIHFDSLTIREVDQTAIAQVPTLTPLPPTPTSPPTETPTPLATATPTTAPPPDGMVLIPAGEFLMGSAVGPANERPEHSVQLDAFYLDMHEVTNAAYRGCVEAGGCSGGGGARLNTPTYESHPIVLVNWDQAKAYCEWAAKRLPSEAEWEYAASGQENLTWPWGNEFEPVRSAASAPDVQPVGSYPDGASPFGVEDLAGNVAEWVADAYDPNFYANSPSSNPLSITGNSRIYRGGSYGNSNGAFYTTSGRFIKSRLFSDVDIGFRCAADLP